MQYKPDTPDVATINKRTSKEGAVQLGLGLASPLDGFLNMDPLCKAVSSKLARDLDLLLATLGIPGKAVVQLHSLGQAISPEDRALSISVNGRLCHYSDRDLELVLAYLSDDIWQQSDTSASAQERLHKQYDKWTQTPDMLGERLGDFFSLICTDAIKSRPSVLFGPDQAGDYVRSLHLKNLPADTNWMRAVLSQVLDLRISIADRSIVKQVFAQGLLEEKQGEDIAEDLISGLRLKTVEIQVPLSYLKEITRDRLGGDRSKFSVVRDGLFYDFGLRFPAINFVPVEDLRPGSFRFKINHLTTLPRSGLSTEKCVADRTPEDLTPLNIQGRTATNPVTGSTFSVVDSSSIQALKDAGIFYWTPLPYIFLCLGAELLLNGPSLVYRESVEADLDQLELAFPALVNARSSVSLEQLTRVLRSLIAERISIRNLKFILERILEYDYVVADPSSTLIFDERLPAFTKPTQAWVNAPANIASFIRIGMKRFIKDKYAIDGTLYAYLVEPEIADIVSEYGFSRYDENLDTLLSEVERQKILKAVRARLGNHPTSDKFAVILTNTSVRSTLRELIRDEFPERAVLAHEENAPDLRIQPLGKISFNS